MKKYNYQFLENVSVPANINQIMQEIARLHTKNTIAKTQYSNSFEYLENIAKIQSIKASNEIEGIVTTDERIKEIVYKKVEPKNHNEREIAGYRDALNEIHKRHNDYEINISNILLINRIMQSKNNRIKGGVFKNKNVNIIEIDNFGHPHLRFKTVDYKFVNSAMQDLTTAFSWAFNNDKIDVLLLIPCFILDFLCIHPFRDGNGRMSRLLSVLLLYQTGYDVVKYISFENEINKTRDYYYDSLHQSSINWHTNKNDYMPFVENFLFMILRCYKEINNRFILVKNKKPTKAQRIYEIIKLNPCPTSKKNIKEMMPDTAIRTIELTLNKLVNQNKINRIGSKKQSTYIPAAAN